MIKLNQQQIKNSAHLFKGISDTALTSCLEGLMGDVYGKISNSIGTYYSATVSH